MHFKRDRAWGLTRVHARDFRSGIEVGKDGKDGKHGKGGKDDEGDELLRDVLSPTLALTPLAPSPVEPGEGERNRSPLPAPRGEGRGMRGVRRRAGMRG